MMKFSYRMTAMAALLTLAGTASAAARDYISIVGSSTVYPFATVVAEHFGNATKYATPKIESTGTGGGMKLFCAGLGSTHPDITNASRRMKASEFKDCQNNGVKEVVEVMIGYDGIVIANSTKGEPMQLSLRDIFLALAKVVPAADGSHKLVANPYQTWKQVNPKLPDLRIEVLGPPPTSGTRDAFNELALEGGCKTFPWLKAMKKTDKKKYKAICRGMREDGHYIEMGENDNLIVQKLEANSHVLGIFGYSFLDQNRAKVQGALVDGVEPTFENIADGKYPVSRSLYFYVKKAHVGVIPGIAEYVREFTSEKAMGDFGYLTEKGLIPATPEQRKAISQRANLLTPMTGKEL